MEYYFWLLIIFSVLLFLLFFPLFVQVRFYINVLQNIGAFSISLFGFIHVFVTQFKLAQKGVVLFSKNKQKDINFDLGKISFIKGLIFAFYKKIKIFNISVFSEFGYKNNAAITANINGIFLILIHLFFSFIHNTKRNVLSFYDNDKRFKQDKFCFCGCVSLFFVPLDILLSFLYAKQKSSKKEKKIGTR